MTVWMREFRLPFFNEPCAAEHQRRIFTVNGSETWVNVLANSTPRRKAPEYNTAPSQLIKKP